MQILERGDLLGQISQREVRHAGRHEGRHAGKGRVELVVVEAALVLFLELVPLARRGDFAEEGQNLLARDRFQLARHQRHAVDAKDGGRAGIQMDVAGPAVGHFLEQPSDAQPVVPVVLAVNVPHLGQTDQLTEQSQRLVRAVAGRRRTLQLVHAVGLVDGVDRAGAGRLHE